MDFLRKEDIVGPSRLKVQELDVPELGGTVRIREMNGLERDELEAYFATVGDTKSFRRYRALVVTLSLVDDEGERIFGDDDVDIVNTQIPWRALDRIKNAVVELNKMSSKAVEETEKNSSPGPSDSSTSD